MAKSIHEYSTTASLNAFAPSDGGCAEGWTGKDVNDAARARMAAFAEFYADSEWRRKLFQVTPYGAKTLSRDSDTVFRIIDATDHQSLFPVGTRLRTYDGVGGTSDCFVASVTLNGSDTEVTVHGGILASPLSYVAWHQSPSLSPLVFSGRGTTAARDTAFPDPPDDIFWYNTTTLMLEVSSGGSWESIGHPGAWSASGGSLALDSPASTPFLFLRRNGTLRSYLSANTTYSELFHQTAAAVAAGSLQIDDDGNLYYAKLGAGRQQLAAGGGAYQINLRRDFDLEPRLAELAADFGVTRATGDYTTESYAPSTIVLQLDFTAADGAPFTEEFGAQLDARLHFQCDTAVGGTRYLGLVRIGLYIGTTGALDPASDTQLKEWIWDGLNAVAVTLPGAGTGHARQDTRLRWFTGVSPADGESLYFAYQWEPTGFGASGLMTATFEFEAVLAPAIGTTQAESLHPANFARNYTRMTTVSLEREFNT